MKLRLLSVLLICAATISRAQAPIGFRSEPPRARLTMRNSGAPAPAGSTASTAPAAAAPSVTAPASSTPGTWTPVASQAPGPVELMLLLPDGTVMAANPQTSNAWYKLTPDSNGSYVNGTWTTLAPMADTRLFYTSFVLKDGRVFVAGGEYGTGGAKGEIYNPQTNTWTSAATVPATLLDPTQPSALNSSLLQKIDDASGMILPDGKILVAPVLGKNTNDTLIYDPVADSWSAGPGYIIQTLDEASWLKLPDDSILTADPNIFSATTRSSERYIPSTNSWIADGTVPVALYDPVGSEIGPAVRLYDGRGFFVGATGNSAFYAPTGSTTAGTWTTGPTLPTVPQWQLDDNGNQTTFTQVTGATPDSAAAVMPNGRVLYVFSGPLYNDSRAGTNVSSYWKNSTNPQYPSPVSFFEFDPATNSFAQVNSPTGGLTDNIAAYQAMMLDLPDGSVLYAHQASDLYVYKAQGDPLALAKPAITSMKKNLDGSYHLVGTLLNGISQGAAYGDDAQMDTNFPIVRLTDQTDGKVYYARTYNWSSTSVATGSKSVTTEFVLPSNLPQNHTFNLVVVANGVASDARQLILPTQPPDVSILQPGDETHWGDFPAISGTTSDYNGYGIDHIDVTLTFNGSYWDGTSWGVEPATITASLNADGTWTMPNPPTGSDVLESDTTPYILAAQAFDAQSNSSSIDRIYFGVLRPKVSVTSPSSGGYTNSSVISGTATAGDGGALDGSVHFTLFRVSDGTYWNGSSWTARQTELLAAINPDNTWSYPPNGTTLNLGDGDYAISAYVQDTDGNRSLAIGNGQPGANQVTFNEDKQPPNLSITTPADGSVVTTATLPDSWITGSATDDKSKPAVTVYLHRTAIAGTNGLTADDSYWTGSTWMYNNRSAGALTTAFTGAGNLGGNWDATSAMPFVGLSYACLTNGQYEIIATAADAAGNVATTTSSITVNYQPNFPAATLDPAQSPMVSADTVNLTELSRTALLADSNDTRIATPQFMRTDPANNFYVGVGYATPTDQYSNNVSYPSAAIQKVGSWRVERQQSYIDVCDNAQPPNCVRHYYLSWGDTPFEVPETDYDNWLSLAGMEVDGQGNTYVAFNVETLQQTYTIDSSGGRHFYSAPADSARVLFIKLDTNGHLVWRQFLGADNNASFYPASRLATMKLASDGSLVALIANTFSYDNGFGQTTSSGGQTIVARFAGADGAYGFLKFFGATGLTQAGHYNSTPVALATDGQLNTLFTSTDTGDLNGDGIFNVLRKLAPDGTLLAETRMSACAGDSSWAAVGADDAGDVYVGSSFQAGDTDYRQSVLKFDSNLSQLWRELAPPNTGSFVAGLAVSTDGVTIGGTISGGYNGTDSLMFTRFDHNGQMLWSRRLPDASALQFVLDANQDALIRGYVWQSVNGGSIGQPGYFKIAGNGDLQILKQLPQEYNAWSNSFALLTTGKPVILNNDYQNHQGVIVALDNPANVTQPAPEISGSNSAYGDVGTQFYYQVNASNNPRSYALTGTLPAGLTFDTTTGVIGGTPATATPQNGTGVAITASNRAGTSAPFNLTIYINDSGVSHTQDIAVKSVTHSPQPAPAGSHITYTVSLHNGGPDSAISTQVTLTPDADNESFYSCSPFCFDNGDGTQTAYVGEVAANTDAIVTYTATVNANAPVGTALSFAAAVSANGTDTNGNNNSGSDNTATTAAATPPPKNGDTDLSINVTTLPASPQVGDTVTYHCVVTNNGPGDATGVTGYFSSDGNGADQYMTFVSSSPAAGPPDQTGFRAVQLGNVAANGTSTFDIVYTAAQNGTAQRFIGTYVSTDPNPGDNSVTTMVTIGYDSGGGGGGGGNGGSADIELTVTNPSQVAAGDNITYRCIVANHGPDLAHNVTLYFYPDAAHESFVSASQSYTVDQTGLYIFQAPTLANGSNMTVDITTRATSPGTAQASMAAFAGESDTNNGNNDVGAKVNITGSGSSTTPTPTPTATATATATATPSPAGNPPQVNSPDSVHVVAGAPFSYQITATNNAFRYGALTQGQTGLPSGITVDASTGVVSGKFSSTGNVVLDVSATNNFGTSDKFVTVQVDPYDNSNPDSAVLSSSTSVTGKVGKPFSFRIDVSHDLGTFLSIPNAAITVDGLPPGITYDAGTQTLVGTAVQAGTYEVLVNITIGTSHIGATLQITISADPAFPELNNPTVSIAEVGQPFSYKITIDNSDPNDPVKYSYSGSLPPGLTFDPNTGTISGTIIPPASSYPSKMKAATLASHYNAPLTLYATNSHGTASQQLKLEVAPKAASTLLNLSTRMEVLTNDQVLIGGFIVVGTEPKLVAARAIGPSLKAAGISNAISDPILELHDSTGALIVANDDWQQSQADQINAIGIPPTDPAESTIIRLLAPGSYTAVVRGKGNTTGVGLVELYDLDRGAAAKPANISTRGFVDSGDSVMIGGFIVGPGSNSTSVLVRGIGPSLGAAGVSGALADPVVELHDGNGAVVAQNDNWQDDAAQVPLINGTGIPPSSSLESALVTELTPGNYTAVLRGKNDGTGVGLVEVYHLQ